MFLNKVVKLYYFLVNSPLYNEKLLNLLQLYCKLKIVILIGFMQIKSKTKSAHQRLNKTNLQRKKQRFKKFKTPPFR